MFEILSSNPVTAIINLITFGGVFLNIVMFIRKSKKENSIIDIILQVNNEQYKAKYSLLRKFVQRSEVKGILRDLLKEQGGYFSIKYLSDEQFIKSILDIQKGKGNKIVIKCNEDEFRVFDKNNFTKIN